MSAESQLADARLANAILREHYRRSIKDLGWIKTELEDLCQRNGWRPKDEDRDDDGQGPQWESEIERIWHGPKE